MSDLIVRSAPPDQAQRDRALDPTRSILVQAPAGSGKTDLLTRRFLRLLAEVDSPSEIVAITFTRAAAAEMRHRILAELEKAAASDRTTGTENGLQPSKGTGLKGTGFSPYNNASQDARALALATEDPANLSMESLARRALARSRALHWNLIDLPAQLRISTIDSFCRELALQQPLVSGLGGGLGVHEQPDELYRRAARRTLEQIDAGDPALRAAIESLLLWRDNNWQEMENLLVEMLAGRDRWMHGFVLEQERDWDALRARLERPFAHAIRAALTRLSELLDQVPHARQEALELARFACEQSEGAHHRELAELADFPLAPFADVEALEEARAACGCLADLLLTGGAFRQRVDKRHGFPAGRKQEKNRFFQLIADLEAIPGFPSALAAAAALPPARYTDEEWEIVRACFTLLRRAVGELRVVFAEAGSVDYIEVAQMAQAVLRSENGFPAEAAFAVADGIRHLLVDEFQDTSRRQHQLLAALIAVWDDREGRSCFVVGDPMQSIYFFRQADAELFARIRDYGLELPNALAGGEPLLFDHTPLSANFRAAPTLVERLNDAFQNVFAEDDGSGIAFSPAQAAREDCARSGACFNLHLRFVPQPARGSSSAAEDGVEREAALTAQTEEITALIRAHLPLMEQARARGKKYRIAVLGRTRAALRPLAQALREAAIPVRAVDLESLCERPEVLDALALARALFNPHDRVAWLGVLRAPWCGLSLADLHALTSADDPLLLLRAVPELLAERAHLLSADGRLAAARVLAALACAPNLTTAVILSDRSAAEGVEGPAVQQADSTTLGTRLEQIWLRLGGEACVGAAARANLSLLWSCLDRLPNGEQDLLSPALYAALEELTAQPDPEASSDHGVQLMTIHKSKGLEFEVVIVPELQARARASTFKMLTWLERGLAERDESGEITEFLIAPFQPKGGERGKAKEWVDRVYRERETQEMRRILYVAATRARAELHFFVRPVYKTEKDGAFTLAVPANSLLATAWPALEEEVRARFEDWRVGAGKQEIEIEALAASANGNLLTMPSQAKPTPLRRLPPDFQLARRAIESAIPKQIPGAPEPVLSLPKDTDFRTWDGPLYSRHEGGVLSRALGAAVHSLLEELARQRTMNDWPAAREALKFVEPRIAAEVRAAGLSPAQAAEIAAQALQLALNAAADPIGAWILSPHAQAQSEARWSGVAADNLRQVRTVRVDRVFQAGPVPGSEGEDCWWLIDYKTAHAASQTDALDPAAALPNLRRLFAPQLEAYAEVLRNLHGDEAPIRAGLYYPRMAQFDCWEL